MVIQGKSFRDAYKEIGEQVQNGDYEPSTSMKHSHLVSKDNLALDEIRKKMNYK